MKPLRSGRGLVAALAIVAIDLPSGAASALEVVGRTAARFTWEPASGPVAAYAVYVARANAPDAEWPRWPQDYALERAPAFAPEAQVTNEGFDTAVVRIIAFAADGQAGDPSEPSHRVRFVTTPSPPSIAFSPAAVFATANPGFEISPAILAVVNSGGGTLDFEATTLTPWARVTPASGSSSVADVALRLDLDASGLGPGVHFSAVMVRASDASATALIPIILTVLPPVPEFTLSPGRATVRALVGEAPQEIALAIGGSAPGAGFSLVSDADWLRPRSETGSIGTGTEPLPLVVDPSGLARGTHSGRLYLIPADPRASGLTVDVVLTVVDPAAVPRVAQDLDANGRSDLVWRDTATGEVQLWLMDGALRLGTAQLAGPAPPGEWTLAAVADLDGDGHADLVWHRPGTGQADAWFLRGLTRLRTATLPATADGWRIVAADDVDADGRADLVLHSANSGQVSVRLMDGTDRVGTVEPDDSGEAIDAVLGTGDFDADGRADLAWRTESGGLRLWLSAADVNGISGQVVPLGAPFDPGWNVAGIADQDGDGRSDILWRNELLRETLLWRLESPTVVDSGALSGVRLPGWRIVASADFGGDGASDLLWRNISTGQTILWEMDGFVRWRATILASPLPPGWDVVR